MGLKEWSMLHDFREIMNNVDGDDAVWTCEWWLERWIRVALAICGLNGLYNYSLYYSNVTKKYAPVAS